MFRPLPIACLTALLATTAAAQSGPAEDALPGAHRVGSAMLGERLRIAAIGWAGYGWIPGLEGEGGDHHRASGAASVAIVPVPYFGASIGMRGYYDVHPGGDGSGVGSLAIAARGAVPLGALAIGGDLRWELNGTDAPDVTLEASRLSLRAIGSLRLAEPALTIDLVLGYRYDGTAASVVRPNELGAGDRVSLGASSFAHSVLVGTGAVLTLAHAELFAELTFEPYVGDDAPNADAGPIRIGTGARMELVSELRVHLALEITAHRRLPANAEGPFVPAEPRVGLLFGISYRPALDREPVVEEPVVEEPVVEEPPVEPPVEPPAIVQGAIRGLVRDFAGRPLHAEVTIEPGGLSAETDEDGLFEVEVRPGEYSVSVRAAGFATQERTVTVTENGVIILNVDMRRAR